MSDKGQLIASSGMKQRQSLCLDDKIVMTKKRIRVWWDHWDGEVYEAFSGGKDSTVLRHIIESMGLEMPKLFSNTGLEYPEIVDFVKKQQETDDSIIITRPKTTFREVILKHGFPLVSKSVAHRVRRVRTQPPESSTTNLYMTGYNSKGEFHNNSKIPEKWKKLVDAPFGTQETCCDSLKKEPFKRYEKETGRKPIAAVMASEGGMRRRFTQCNIYEGATVISYPMLFWMEEDVWEYIERFNVEYADIYKDREITTESGKTVQIKGEERTGCMFCAFGAHLEKSPNRFQRMAVSHPKQWNYLINKLKMDEALDFIDVPYKPEPDLFDGE